MRPVVKRSLIGIAIAVVVIVALAVGLGVGLTQHNDNDSDESGSGSQGSQAAASSAASIKEQVGIFPTATDSQYLIPIYPSTVSPSSSRFSLLSCKLS